LKIETVSYDHYRLKISFKFQMQCKFIQKTFSGSFNKFLSEKNFEIVGELICSRNDDKKYPFLEQVKFT